MVRVNWATLFSVKRHFNIMFQFFIKLSRIQVALSVLTGGYQSGRRIDLVVIQAPTMMSTIIWSDTHLSLLLPSC